MGRDVDVVCNFYFKSKVRCIEGIIVRHRFFQKQKINLALEVKFLFCLVLSVK